ncbi:hypothetical protein GALL_308970 [mine drainage metagenome]|uniref:Uncharacterized protein n=1 Tax=mine drainage metagenome TaxID=410659 RepID=A0A1J5QUB2_9ZZZZ
MALLLALVMTCFAPMSRQATPLPPPALLLFPGIARTTDSPTIEIGATPGHMSAAQRFGRTTDGRSELLSQGIRCARWRPHAGKES